MKKTTIIISSIIVLITTLVIAHILGIYNFGDYPTILTITHLISLFSIMEYLTITFIYIIKKKNNKQKITTKNIACITLFFISLLLTLYFIYNLSINKIHYYQNYSQPFHITILLNAIEFLIPAFILFTIGLSLTQKKFSTH